MGVCKKKTIFLKKQSYVLLAFGDFASKTWKDCGFKYVFFYCCEIKFVCNRLQWKTTIDTVLLRCHELVDEELLALHFGQGMDIFWHSGQQKADPNVEEYLQMCAYKTGTLARLSAKLSALVSGATEEQVHSIGKFAETIGVAFQIQDDILNLVGEKFGDLKGVGEDIHEGKRTLMVLHSFEVNQKKKKKKKKKKNFFLKKKISK